MPTRRIALLATVLVTCFTAAALAQVPPAAHKHGAKTPPAPLNNQFNLPAYSPLLMPYSPPLGSPLQSIAPVQSPPRQVPAHPITPIAFFCPQLGGYFPTIQHCPTEWVRVKPEPEHRRR
jgi:hypothetical protein